MLALSAFRFGMVHAPDLLMSLILRNFLCNFDRTCYVTHHIGSFSIDCRAIPHAFGSFREALQNGAIWSLIAVAMIG
jgi:hypothetical protein